MKTSKTRLFLVFFALAVPLILLFVLSTAVTANTSIISEVSEVDPELRVEIAPNLSYVELENSQLFVRYGTFFENHNQFAIRNFVFKGKGFVDQAGLYLDADEFRGQLQSATLVNDGVDQKTVRLVWNQYNKGTGIEDPNKRIIHEVTLFANRAFLKIHYVDVRYGINIVDNGLPGGLDTGAHVAYGGSLWSQLQHPEWPPEYGGYVTLEYTPTVGSYYNRHPQDGVMDPNNGGYLNYNGHFILGVYEETKSAPNYKMGIGRVMPVSTIPVIKLLLDKDHRRGFDFLPLGTATSFVGYLYPVTQGPVEIIEMGKQLANGAFGTYNAAAFQSDDFNRCSWTEGTWTFIDPLDDATFNKTSTGVEISVPAAVDHDIWGTGPGDFANNAPRIMQASNNTDFEIEAKFDSGVGQRYQTQGILIQQDADDMLRFEFHGNGTNTQIFAGYIKGGVGLAMGDIIRNIGTVNISPLYMRVSRIGNIYRQYYSLNGEQWEFFNTTVLTQTFSVNQVGVYAGNTADVNGQQPAHTGVIDYVFNTLNPITPEDGNPNNVTVNIVGQGTVTKNPDKTEYACGEVVSLTASPAIGWNFSAWSGDATGSANPASVTLDGPKSVTATFIQQGYTLNVTTVGNGTVTKNPDKATYAYNEQVTLTAVPGENAVFTGWSGDAAGTQNPQTITITKNTNVTANFSGAQYTLSVSVSPAGKGSVTKNPDKATYTVGEQVSLTAVPSAGYMFTGWSGDLAGSANPATVTITKNTTIVANFAPFDHQLYIPYVTKGP